MITLGFISADVSAQENWASFSRVIPGKDIAGHKFRITAKVRTEVIDDSASARLWARADTKSGTGYFNNMQHSPIRVGNWKTYSLEGQADSSAEDLVAGFLLSLNGKFFFDDYKLEVEQKPGKWVTLINDDFSNGSGAWTAGIGRNMESGVNKLFSMTTVADATTKSSVLLIQATEAPNYGFNKKAGKFADVNGIRLYYEVYGDGPPLVILHGNGGSIDNASEFYPELIKNYKVIGIDSRGQGRSTDTDKPLTYDQMASDVNTLLDQIHVDSAFFWGQSDGAILCLLMAKDYPKKVKRALAYAPNILPDSTAVYGWAVTAVNKTVNTSKDPKEVKLWTMMRDYPNVPYEDLEKISAPIMIMGGDRDVIRPEHLTKMYQHIRNSQLCILPGSTHGGAWENHEMFLKILNNFFLKPFRMPDTKDWFQ